MSSIIIPESLLLIEFLTNTFDKTIVDTRGLDNEGRFGSIISKIKKDNATSETVIFTSFYEHTIKISDYCYIEPNIKQVLFFMEFDILKEFYFRKVSEMGERLLKKPELVDNTIDFDIEHFIKINDDSVITPPIYAGLMVIDFSNMFNYDNRPVFSYRWDEFI